MNTSLYPRRNRGRSTLFAVGWFLLVGLGILLTWYGFVYTGQNESPEDVSTAVAASTASPQATAPPTATPSPAPAVPTNTPSPPPTPIPPTAPPPTPYIVAGADGVNVRDGPSTSYERLGYIEPGDQAEVTGSDDDWWQIMYNDAPGWVFGELVTAYNTEQPELPPVTPTTQAESPPVINEAWAVEVFQIINSVRAEHGLPPYTYNETLELAAQLHGQDCLERGELTHIGSDGSNASTRILRAGYDAAGAAEITVTSSSPQAAVDWWMDEIPPNDPHRSAILSTWFTEIGIAVVPAGNTNYFIVDLGRPKTP